MSDKYVPRQWQPHERPTLPGSASTPVHPTRLRIAYGLVGVVVALTGGLSNALVTANLVYLQGTLGAYAAEMAWLPAAYVMTNMSANLVLVKFRQQFGLRLFTEIFLTLYALIAFAHLFVHSLGSAISVRAAHGLVGAALSSLGLYYMIQAFPAKHRLKAVVTGLGLTQLALPLARVFSTELLEFGEWRGLYLFELGLAVFALACVLALKLPPGDRYRVFEKLDAATFVLFAGGSAGLAAVLSLGRVLWWTSTPWLGVVLAGSIVLLCAAVAIEHNRTRPMLNTRWLASGDILRLVLAVVLLRLVLSEQATGALGFFQGIGLNNDQMHTLFWLMLLGATCGIVASALLINPNHITEHLITAVAAIAIGCFLDARATSLTRPEQMYASQFLLAFGSTFFVAPAMVAGIGRVATQPGNLISFVVMFGMAQNMGGLLGSAFLGTLQTVREKFHANQLMDHLVLTDPQVAARLQAYASAYARALPDAAARQNQAMRTLSGIVTREATVLAYNDVFLTIGLIAIATLIWFLLYLIKRERQRRRDTVASSLPATARA
ncbi:MAG TPA: MFS transporter [Stenotrophomonas sp.]|nr:MFS transporter [Stenotrophomonas sp.]